MTVGWRTWLVSFVEYTWLRGYLDRISPQVRSDHCSSMMMNNMSRGTTLPTRGVTVIIVGWRTWLVLFF
jgi:hypothetical protein